MANLHVSPKKKLRPISVKELIKDSEARCLVRLIFWSGSMPDSTLEWVHKILQLLLLNALEIWIARAYFYLYFWLGKRGIHLMAVLWLRICRVTFCYYPIDLSLLKLRPRWQALLSLACVYGQFWLFFPSTPLIKGTGFWESIFVCLRDPMTS